MSQKIEQIKMVYCVTSYGKVVGVYADSQDAFQIQMSMINKGRLAELVPMPIIYPLNQTNV